MLYDIARRLLFKLNAESAHTMALKVLRAAPERVVRYGITGRVPSSPRSVMGLTFPNPVGVAAGLDKNADYIDALASLGFGFIEVGTVTPRAQPGNPRPRLFRVPEARALINRMGFNNRGVDYLIGRIESASYRGILGINLGKNFDTPMHDAVEDYVLGLRKVYAHAHYVTVNISSPNTPGLRDLQRGPALRDLLGRLKSEQSTLAEIHSRYVPLTIKIAPDLNDVDIAVACRAMLDCDIDAVIATNTTAAHEGVENYTHGEEPGGVSGAPLQVRSTEVVRRVRENLGPKVPIIAVGGILSGADAATKLAAGANLVQLYTGLIYRGPRLVGEVARALAATSNPQSQD